MFFLIPGYIGPSRMLGNREPIILCKLQKIRAILSALFLGRYIKGALEPEHSYHSGPWLKVSPDATSLFSSVCDFVPAAQGKRLRTCCGESSMAMASAFPSLPLLDHGVKYTLNCLKPSHPLPLHPWWQVCQGEQAQSHRHRACPDGIHQISLSRSLGDQDLPWMVLIGLLTDWKSQ